MAPVSSTARADAASLQCNLARVLGSSEFTNLIAAWAVLISEGNLGAKPGGAFFSLIGMKGRRNGLGGSMGQPISGYGQPSGGVRPDHPTPAGRPPVSQRIADCYARAASGHAAAPPSSVMKSRRFMFALIRSPRRRGRAAWVGKWRRESSLEINDQLDLRDSHPCVLTQRQLQLLEPRSGWLPDLRPLRTT